MQRFSFGRVIASFFFVAVCAFVLGLYAWTARPSVRQIYRINDPSYAYYNLLVEGFRHGQLNLKREAPPELAQLPDPYDPVANEPYREKNGDLSYYRGKLYLYFGVTPALLLFWPYAVLTGHHLFHKQAVAVFCAIGFLTSVWLLRAVRRRYFPGVGEGVDAAGALALGLATTVPVMLQRPDLWEVPISCGYAMVMLALAAIWQALHDPLRRYRWLAAASLAYGLAIGARPSLFFGVVILLAPVVHAGMICPEPGRAKWHVATRAFLAATVPIFLIGLGLMLYNYRRFDSPFEFGQHFQLSGNGKENKSQGVLHFRYFLFNLRLYFLQPMHWFRSYPFLRLAPTPPAPSGQFGVANPVGVLPNVPIACLVLAVPLMWRGRQGKEGSTLRLFAVALMSFAAMSLITVCLFAGVTARYEMDFLPVILLLASGGVLGLERVLASRPKCLVAVRTGWVALLLFSAADNLLIMNERNQFDYLRNGVELAANGRAKEATNYFECVLSRHPDYPAAHYYHGVALAVTKRLPEAIDEFKRVLRLDPGYPGAVQNLVQAEQMQAHAAHPERIK